MTLQDQKDTRPTEHGPFDTWIETLQSAPFARVEQRLLRQLIEALVFERILPYEDQTQQRDPGLIVLTGTTEGGQPVRYLAEGRFLDSYGLLRLSQQPVMRVVDGAAASEATLAGFSGEILTRLLPETDRLDGFLNELEHTLLKDVQAQVTAEPGRLSETQRQYDALEGHLMDAHSYHPCYKSRLGFSLADNQQFGPEFQQAFPLRWVALHKDKAQMNASVHLNLADYVRQVVGEDDAQRFEDTLRAQGKDPNDYVWLPVHPWQWQERVALSFYPELASGDLIDLGTGRDEYRAQQSIRTLANATDPTKPYAKVSLGITNTSTLRIMAAHTCLNGPVISDWLQGLIEDDPIARDMDFIVLGEVAGVTCDYETLPAARRLPAYGHLGVVWRESLHAYLRTGEAAVPMNGLSHVQGNGEPLIDDWIRRYGVNAWMRQVLTVTVGPIVHLLLGHGIGLESHGQNIVLIHDNGWPTRIALKDFHDGVRYSPSHLAHPDRAPGLFPIPATHARINPNSYILTDNLDEIRDYSLDAFFFIALSDLVGFLNDRYDLPEADFWRETARVIHDYQAAHPEHAERFRQFDLFTPDFEIEALAQRRLLGDDEPRVLRVRNPLADFAQEAQ